jgi:hypothetical protein
LGWRPKLTAEQKGDFREAGMKSAIYIARVRF